MPTMFPSTFCQQQYRMMNEYELIYPLDDLIEQHGFDLSELNPGIVSFLRSLDSEGRIVGFPDGTSYKALFYNKEVFDLFGEPYPDPDKPMTWEETLDLAARMTATRMEKNTSV